MYFCADGVALGKMTILELVKHLAWDITLKTNLYKYAILAS